MTILTKDTPAETILLCQGSAPQSQSQEVLQAFRNLNLEPGKPCSLDIAGVTEADFTFLQVLISFFKKAEAGGIPLRLVPLPEGHELRDLLDLAGVDPGRGFHPREGTP